MLLGFSYFIWGLALLILIFIIAFLFYRQIIGINLFFLNIAFIIAGIIAITALFVPGIFHSFANTVFENTPFAVTLKDFDTSITNVSKVPNQLLDELRSLLRQNPSQNQDVSFQSELYPNFLDLVGSMFRWAAFILAVLIMAFIVYLKYAFSGVYQTKELRKEIEDLQKRLKLLETHQ